MRSLLAILVVAVMMACSSSETAQRRIPNDLIIRYAEGGGFTGQWTGAVITQDGTVRSWTPRANDSVSTILTTLSASTMENLWSTIMRDDLLNRPSGGEPGNMTRLVFVSSGGKSVEVQWSYGTTPDARTQPYAALFDLCRASVTSAKR